jgi:subtilase family serine protease
MKPSGPANPKALLRIAIELAPKDPSLDALAAAMTDPNAPTHRRPLTGQEFDDRFGREASLGDALTAFLKKNGASNVFVSRSRLVSGGIMDLATVERVFKVQFQTFTAAGGRTAIAPMGPLTVPFANVRDVRGTVLATTPRLADVTRPSYTLFRGNWYTPEAFRENYDAVAGGGNNERITIVEDASDKFDTKDVNEFLESDGAPPGASMTRISEASYAFKAPSSDCGRDDRGQEPGLDVDSALTMAPLASITAVYDDVCSLGDDGTIAVQRALDEGLGPTVIVFPFTLGPTPGSIIDDYGKPTIPMLEAMVRGIPLVVPAGDDGSYGYKLPGIDTPGVSYPCVSIYVICAGGTQLGDRDGYPDEAPWNDGEHATGGGISNEPRPAWQNAPSIFEFANTYVKNRIVPDVSADAGGHLLVYWHGYGLGGVGGTSESASVVAGQIAAINSLVPPNKRLQTASDLYALANLAPKAFRDVQRENDRGYTDNTLRPRRLPLPKGYRGIVPATPAPVNGCTAVQPAGCSVRPGFNAVNGLGSLKEKVAVDALRQP